MMKGVLDPSSLPLEVADTTMLGKPACSLAYKLNMGGQRQVEQTWTENRGRSFIVTRAGPGTTSLTLSLSLHTHTPHNPVLTLRVYIQRTCMRRTSRPLIASSNLLPSCPRCDASSFDRAS